MLNFNWTIHCLDTKKGTKNIEVPFVSMTYNTVSINKYFTS